MIKNSLLLQIYRIYEVTLDTAELILSDDEARKRDAFVERMLASTSGTFDIFKLFEQQFSPPAVPL